MQTKLKDMVGSQVVVVALSFVVLGCAALTSNDSSGSTYRFGNYEVEKRHYQVTDPNRRSALDDAFSKYSIAPVLDDCYSIAKWHRDGLEVVLEGEMLRQIEEDPSVESTEQILLSTNPIFGSLLYEILTANPSLCSREEYLRVKETLPVIGPNAQRAEALFNERGGYYNMSASEHLGWTVDDVAGVPRVFEVDCFKACTFESEDESNGIRDLIPLP